MSILELREVAVHFPGQRGGWFQRAAPAVRAVDGVGFALEEGETLGLVGESGCGKSTLSRAIVQLLRPTAGQVLLRHAGAEVDLCRLDGAALRATRRTLQMVFQDPYASLDPRLTTADIVAEPLIAFGVARGAALRQRVGALLELVGLSGEQLRRYPHEFSGGQRQRIGLARALALEPRILICDEPVSALDVSIQAQIINLLKDLQRRLGLTLLFISHDLAVVRHVADRVAVMLQGRIVEIGACAGIYRAPQHGYTRTLLAAIPGAEPVARP